MKEPNRHHPPSPEKSFQSPLIGFICLSIIVPLTTVFYWPYPSTEPVWVTSYDIDKTVRTTLDTSELPTHLMTLAWAYHLLSIVVTSAFCILMTLVCAAFNERAHFTTKSIRYFSIIRWILITGLITYWVMGLLLDAQVIAFFQNYPHITVNQEWANVPVLSGFLVLMIIYFIEGALRRGLTLQEDADATI